MLYSVAGLPQLNGVVNISRKVQTLHTNFEKSKLVPLANDLHDPAAQCQRVRDRLAHLGYDVGPTAGKSAWDTPKRKWKQRSLLLADTMVSSSVTARLYVGRCVAVLGYVSAMTAPPEDVQIQEQQVVARLLRAPYCSYLGGLIHRWRRCGVPSLPMLDLHMQANRVVTAIRMAPLWRPLAASQTSCALHSGRVSCATMNAMTPVEPGWTSPAFAFALENALGKCEHHRDEGVRSACEGMLAGSPLDRSFMYQSLLASGPWRKQCSAECGNLP